MGKLKALFLILSLSQLASAASVCDDPLKAPSICFSMANIRSQILMLESQRDLMQINYDYMKVTASSLADLSLKAQAQMGRDLQDHADSLKVVAAHASQIADEAAVRNPQVFATANSIRKTCLSCHSESKNPSGSWGDIFRSDWNSILKKCNSPGKNPYLCKQMHGMVTTYDYIVSAEAGKIQNYEVTEQAANEVSRISADLIKNGFQHNRKANLGLVNQLATEIAAMAKAKNPGTFDKAYELTDGCVSCHKSDISKLTTTKLPINSWK